VLPFKLVYSDGYDLPIGPHIFPAEKYELVRARLLKRDLAELADFVLPEPAGDDEILLVHTQEYIRKLKTGALSQTEIMQMEIPYSPELVRTVWLATGGSILAAELALRDGICINICGGFHHAYPDHGEGFCVVNDVAIAIKSLHKRGKLLRAMTVDCDVHHGNGTAAIFPPKSHIPRPFPDFGVRHKGLRAVAYLRDSSAKGPEVFTISLHQTNNYPLRKPPSSIDVHLPQDTDDEEYLGWLDLALTSASQEFEPNLICYLAGADPYREDQLGGLALTIHGLQKRDELVFAFARARNIPVMVTLAGGYARQVEDTVTIHCNTVVAATNVFATRPS
jgi:acetoin utilization deacetylase AcuC-like enzyme